MEQINSWQLIETAPNDGSPFDVLVTEYNLNGIKTTRRYVNVFQDKFGFVCGGTYLAGVTHWMLPPPLPKESK